MDGAGITQRSLGLSGWEEAALTRPLACCCRADGLERSGWGWLAAGSQAEWRWKRRRDPWRGKSFCRGRVCFNAGLSWEAVLVHCYWQCWSLERCFALPIVPSRNPILPPVRSWAHNSQLSSFHKETRRLSLPHRGAAGRSTPVRFWLEQCVPFRACVAPVLLSCLLQSILLDVPDSPASIPSNCPATSICIALYAPVLYGGEVCLHFDGVS